MTTLETRLRVAFTQVAGSAAVPPLPESLLEPRSALDEVLSHADVSPRPRRARRRRTLAGIAAVVVLGGGLSVAASAGLPVLPTSVVQALGWSPVPGAYNPYPATTRTLLRVPGPNGRPLHLLYADASDHGYCLSLTSVVTGTRGRYGANPTAQPADGVGAGGCAGPVGGHWWHEFGGELITASNSGSSSFIVHVPGAATVHLEFRDGTSRELPIGEHWTAGCLTPRAAGRHPVLVGVAADGRVIGRRALF